MVSLAKIGRMSMAASSFILPTAKLIAGLWFLKSSVKLVWKCVKPIRDQIRKRSPRFSSGRVQKFYKLKLARVKRRKYFFLADIVEEEEDEIPTSEKEIDKKLVISQSFTLCQAKFTPPRVKRREERKKKEEERKTCRKTLFLADIVEEEEDEIPFSDKEIDMKLLVSQSFAPCPAKCCLAVAHDEDEGKAQGEVSDILRSEKEYLVNEKVQEKVGTEKCPTEEDIHEKIVEDIGLKCITWVPDEPHYQTSTSPIYESPCMTSTPFVSTMPVMFSVARSLDEDCMQSSGEAFSGSSCYLRIEENVEASLSLFSPINEQVSHEVLASVQNDSDAVAEIQTDNMVIEEKDYSEEIPIEDLFKHFIDTSEDSHDASIVCLEDVKTEND